MNSICYGVFVRLGLYRNRNEGLGEHEVLESSRSIVLVSLRSMSLI